MKMKNKQNKKPKLRYWLIEQTSTDGQVHQYYVKAFTIIDAYRMADEWGTILDECEELRGFKLRH